MITCREFAEFLLDYTSGELPEDQKAIFEKHMKMCPPCVAYLESYKKTIEMGRMACEKADDAPPPAAPPALLKAILKARPQADDEPAKDA